MLSEYTMEKVKLAVWLGMLRKKADAFNQSQQAAMVKHLSNVRLQCNTFNQL